MNDPSSPDKGSAPPGRGPAQPLNPQTIDPASLAPLRGADSLSFVMDVPVELTIELGRKQVKIGDVLRLGPGSVLELDKASGELLMSAGSPGGALIIHYTAKTLLGTLAWRLNAQQAINLPNFGSNNGPTLLEAKRFPLTTIEALKSRGHNVVVGEPWSEGRLSACGRERDAKGRWILKAAANPRRMQGYAVGR